MPTFLNRFSWLLSGHVALAGSQAVMLVLLAKLGSPQFVGSFALALAITGPIILFATLNQRSIIASSSAPGYAFGDHLGLRLVLLAAATLVILGIAVLGPIGATTALTIVFVGVARMLWGVSDVFYGLFLRHSQDRIIGISLLLRSGLGLLGVTLGLVLFQDVVAAAAGMAVGWMIPLFTTDLPAARREVFSHAEDPQRFTPSWDTSKLGSLFTLSLPLGLAVVLISLNKQIPKYVIGYFHGAADLGYYAALATLIVAGTTMINVLSQAALPRLGRLRRTGDERGFATLMLRLSGVALGLGAAGFLLTWLVGRPLIALIYTPEYVAHLNVLYWLIAAGTAGYLGWVLDAGLTSTGQYRSQAVAMACGTVLILALSLLLVPSGGLVGGALALLAGLVTAAVLKAAVLGTALAKGFTLADGEPVSTRAWGTTPE